jgi:putative ABC transport system permease protein
LFGNWQIISGILIITLTAGLFAGFYPGLYMSSLKPVQIFSKKIKFGGSNLFTKSLVVLQFALATFFILGTFIIASQLRFIQNKDLGFDKEQVVVIHGNYQKVNVERIMHLFKSNFANDPDIAGITGIRYSFTRGYDNIAYEDDQGKKRILYVYRIDENFVDLMNMEIAEGRNFSKNFPTDSTNAVIVNESLVKTFGIQDPIGKQLDGFKNGGLEDPVIIGVVKDFHFESLKSFVEPAVMYINSSDKILFVYAKLKPNHIQSGLDKLQTEWNRVEPSVPFQYSFLDADLGRQYRDAQQRRVVINYSAGFAVFIAAIGLFGMASYSSVRRKKEIGIRKILGASVRSIISLLNREFVMLLITANILAWPAAYFSMENWLEDFAYRVEIGWWVFALSAAIVLTIAFVTVSFHAIKTAVANPVESLRYE